METLLLLLHTPLFDPTNILVTFKFHTVKVSHSRKHIRTLKFNGTKLYFIIHYFVSAIFDLSIVKLRFVIRYQKL